MRPIRLIAGIKSLHPDRRLAVGTTRLPSPEALHRKEKPFTVRLEQSSCNGDIKALPTEGAADLDMPAVAHFLSRKVFFLDSGGSVGNRQFYLSDPREGLCVEQEATVSWVTGL